MASSVVHVTGVTVAVTVSGAGAGPGQRRPDVEDILPGLATLLVFASSSSCCGSSIVVGVCFLASRVAGSVENRVEGDGWLDTLYVISFVWSRNSDTRHVNNINLGLDTAFTITGSTVTLSHKIFYKS